MLFIDIGELINMSLIENFCLNYAQIFNACVTAGFTEYLGKGSGNRSSEQIKAYKAAGPHDKFSSFNRSGLLSCDGLNQYNIVCIN